MKPRPFHIPAILLCLISPILPPVCAEVPDFAATAAAAAEGDAKAQFLTGRANRSRDFQDRSTSTRIEAVVF